MGKRRTKVEGEVSLPVRMCGAEVCCRGLPCNQEGSTSLPMTSTDDEQVKILYDNEPKVAGYRVVRVHYVYYSDWDMQETIDGDQRAGVALFT